MNYLQIISVPAIATAVYWAVNLIKYAVNNNEKFKRLIPLLSAGLGTILGVVCFYAVPSIIAAPNVMIAIISGGASGLSATGCNQIMKQLNKEKEMTEINSLEYQLMIALLKSFQKDNLLTSEEIKQIMLKL